MDQQKQSVLHTHLILVPTHYDTQKEDSQAFEKTMARKFNRT